MSSLGHTAFGPANGHEGDLFREREFYAVLLGMAGHDLRQPLQVLLSTHEWLDHHIGQGIGRVQLARGQRAVVSLRKQLDGLISAMRLYEQTSDMKLSAVPVQPIFDVVGEECREMAMKADIDLRLCSTRAVVFSNDVVLEGIVRNLVRNAIKYTTPGNRVLIGCRRRGTDVRIDICDTGIGLAPDQVPKAFEAFKRLDTSNTDGLGLGLYVVRRAVALLRHRIEVQSSVGRGSRFSIIARSASSRD